MVVEERDQDRLAAVDDRAVQRVTDPPGVGPLGLEPAEHRRRRPVRAGPGEPRRGEMALQGPGRGREPAVRGQHHRDLRGGPVRSLRLQRHRQLQHRRRGLRGDPPRRRAPARRTRRRGRPGSTGPGWPGRSAPAPAERPRVGAGGDRPDQPAPLLGAQRGVQRVLDQAVPEQPHLPRPGPAGPGPGPAPSLTIAGPSRAPGPPSRADQRHPTGHGPPAQS